jgi:hypothetical protein
VENQFEQFIKQRQYLASVTPVTVEWYRGLSARKDGRLRATQRRWVCIVGEIEREARTETAELL